jgi:hypothetical protein
MFHAHQQSPCDIRPDASHDSANDRDTAQAGTNNIFSWAIAMQAERETHSAPDASDLA